MPDFPKKIIEIRYATDSWGPHNFDLEKAIPSGTSISSVVVKSYLGKVDKGTDLSAETETTSELIDAIQSLPISATVVSCYFDYPVTAAWQGQKHTLVFEITLDNGAVHPFFHHFLETF